MKIQINQVEGKTSRKGLKQNQLLTIVNESEVEGFYTAINENRKGFTIWNVYGDWSLLGIQREEKIRMTYTKCFEIINH